MDDALVMRRLQRQGYLSSELARLGERQRSTLQPLGKGFTFDKFQHERPARDRILDAVYSADVRVVQRRQHARFALQARHPVGIIGERGRQNLDRDIAAKACVVRPEDLAHPTAAQQGIDAVAAEVCAEERRGLTLRGHGRMSRSILLSKSGRCRAVVPSTA